jgi:hypothetical protein
MAPQFDRALRDLLRAAGCTFVREGKGRHEVWHSPLTNRNFAVPVGIPSRHTAKITGVDERQADLLPDARTGT